MDYQTVAIQTASLISVAIRYQWDIATAANKLGPHVRQQPLCMDSKTTQKQVPHIVLSMLALDASVSTGCKHSIVY